jgi:hypothetical protein
MENSHRIGPPRRSRNNCHLSLNGQSVFPPCPSHSFLTCSHHPFDVLFGSALGLLFAWMAYRQYFPPLALAEGGRPYSIAEFATEKGEAGRPAYAAAQPYATPATYTDQSDLELGNRPRQRRKDIPGADGWEDSERTSTVPLRADDSYKPGPSFDEPTEYRRPI